MKVTHESEEVVISFIDSREKVHVLRIFEHSGPEQPELTALYKGPQDQEWESVLSVLLNVDE